MINNGQMVAGFTLNTVNECTQFSQQRKNTLSFLTWQRLVALVTSLAYDYRFHSLRFCVVWIQSCVSEKLERRSPADWKHLGDCGRALPRHAGAGWDLPVPSEVTALTSACGRACGRACTAAASQLLRLEKRTEPGAPGTGWRGRFWRGGLLTANVSFVAKTQPARWCVGQKKRKKKQPKN